MDARYLRRMSLVLGFVILAPVLQGCGVVDTLLGGLARGLAALCEQPTLTVTKTVDTNDGACTSGDCSLREAIQTANACLGPQVIELPDGVYELNAASSYDEGMEGGDARVGDLDIAGDLTIVGEGNAVVDGRGTGRIFDIPWARRDLPAPTVQMIGLTITGGGRDAVDEGGPGLILPYGGAIRNFNGFLTLRDVTLRDNTSFGGGAIFNIGGTMQILGGVIVSNHCVDGPPYWRDCRGGGGILNRGDLEMHGTLVAENTSEGEGGGIAMWGGGTQLRISDSVLRGNTAERGGGLWLSSVPSVVLVGVAVNGNKVSHDGGGILLEGDAGRAGRATLTNVLISGNDAGDGGDGIIHLSGRLELTNVTVSGNGGEGIRTDGNLDVLYSTIADNGRGILGLARVNNSILDDGCSRDIDSEGYNIFISYSCMVYPVSLGDVLADPLLGPLQDNGGPTFTHAILAGSPARNAGNSADCPASDQRGITRPQGPGCDIGAYEEEFLRMFVPGGTPIGPPIPEIPPSPVPTPTFSPVSLEIEAEVRQNANCRSRPGTAYPVVSLLAEGQSLPVEGRNAQSTWWWVLINGSTHCWVSDVAVELSGGAPSLLPVIPVPPLPATPTPTPTRTPTPVVTPPNAPSNLIVASASCSAEGYTVTLLWTDNAKNETGYRVYRNDVLVATLPANSTGYTDTLPCCGPTTYGVEAYNSGGSSKRAEVTEGECVY